jgi:glycosyltransferase involved in cell wall biosynthesis
VQSRWPRAFKNGQYNIGYWFFELPKLPDDWRVGFRGLDEIWVASQFVYDTIRSATDIPVYLIPTPVSVNQPIHVDRSRFNIPKNCFCILSVFDLNSHYLRKNPEAVIVAFKMAEQQVPNMHLVIKVNNADRNLASIELIRNSIEGLDNVTLILELLSREELTALQACSDVFVSLHRSEGLGLNLLECMLLEKPVIATNWSANTDYMTQENSCPVGFELVKVQETFGPYEKGQIWADPNITEASRYLVALSKNPDLRHKIGRRGRETVLAKYSPDICRKAMEDRLRKICDDSRNS